MPYISNDLPIDETGALIFVALCATLVSATLTYTLVHLIRLGAFSGSVVSVPEWVETYEREDLPLLLHLSNQPGLLEEGVRNDIAELSRVIWIYILHMRAIRRMDLGWLNPWLNQSKRSEAIAETQVTFEEIKRLILAVEMEVLEIGYGGIQRRPSTAAGSTPGGDSEKVYN